MIARNLSWGHRVSQLTSAGLSTHLGRETLSWGIASIQAAYGYVCEDIYLAANWYGKTLHTNKKNELQGIKNLNKTETSRWKRREDMSIDRYG